MNDQEHPLVARERRALGWPRVRQTGRLAIGVGGITGGIALLASNVIHVATVGVTTAALVPLAANVALIFGGAMFLRAYRKGRGK